MSKVTYSRETSFLSFLFILAMMPQKYIVRAYKENYKFTKSQKYWFGLVSLFNSISIFVGYLMP